MGLVAHSSSSGAYIALLVEPAQHPIWNANDGPLLPWEEENALGSAILGKRLYYMNQYSGCMLENGCGHSGNIDPKSCIIAVAYLS